MSSQQDLPEPVPGAVTGAALRAMRQAVGLNLRPMSALLGCSHQHLARVETGERTLTRDFADRFARVIANKLAQAAA